jgi:hypothetical protein
MEFDPQNHVLVQLEIELNNIGNDDVDFQELVSFLDQVELIHVNAIRSTQLGYPSEKLRNNELFDHHRLKVQKISMNSPARFILSCVIDIDRLFPYLLLLKTFFKFCKRYGRNTEALQTTIEKIAEALAEILRNLRPILRRINFGDRINSPTRIKEIFEELLNNTSFKRAYNSFCSTGIVIAECISICSFLDQKFEFNLLD